MRIGNNIIKIHFAVGGLVQPHGHFSRKTKAQNEVREGYAYIGILNQPGHKEDPWTWNNILKQKCKLYLAGPFICILELHWQVNNLIELS